MTERLRDYDQTTDRHLSLVQAEVNEVEYDESFIGPSRFEVRIVFQGDAVVRNRKQLLSEMAQRATAIIVR